MIFCPNPNLHAPNKFVGKCQQNHVRVTPEMINGMQQKKLCKCKAMKIFVVGVSCCKKNDKSCSSTQKKTEARFIKYLQICNQNLQAQ